MSPVRSKIRCKLSLFSFPDPGRRPRRMSPVRSKIRCKLGLFSFPDPGKVAPRSGDGWGLHAPIITPAPHAPSRLKPRSTGRAVPPCGAGGR